MLFYIGDYFMSVLFDFRIVKSFWVDEREMKQKINLLENGSVDENSLKNC